MRMLLQMFTITWGFILTFLAIVTLGWTPIEVLNHEANGKVLAIAILPMAFFAVVGNAVQMWKEME